jgi:aerobic carbon-monoxide dehydrogenase medium subunit
MQVKEYHKPASVNEAVELLRRKSPRTVVLSGGTWLNGEGPRDVEAVVDIGALGLDRIERQSNPPLLRIGAAVTLQALTEALRDTPGLDVISTAARAMAALNVRNRATIGGAIATADSSSPLVTALLASDADLVVQAAEERIVSLAAFLSYREPLMADGVLITRVQMPIPSADTSAAYERVARTPSDYPIVCAVARCAMKDGIAGNVRVAVGGVAPAPIRLNTLEFALEKKRVAEHLDAALNDAVARLTPAGDWLGSAEYRAEMARVLVRRVIIDAARLKL